MYYRETSMCISWLTLHYCDILIFHITVILYLFAGGHKCRLTIFLTRFAHDVSIMCCCHSLLCFNVIVVP